MKNNDDDTPSSVSIKLYRDVPSVSFSGDYLSTSLDKYPDPTLENSACKNVTLLELCGKYYNSATCTQNVEKPLGDVFPYYVNRH